MKNESAFPTSMVFPSQEGPNPGDVYGGLNKREWFAGLAMQGMLIDRDFNATEAAKKATSYADALIAELERKEE